MEMSRVQSYHDSTIAKRSGPSAALDGGDLLLDTVLNSGGLRVECDSDAKVKLESRHGEGDARTRKVF